MAVDVVGRANYELGVDQSGVKTGLRETDGLVKASGKALEEQYKSSAYRAGEAIGTGIKVGVKIAGGAAAVAFGIATKGVVELEDATASYRSETGATAEQARLAGKAINDMSSRNIQPVKEIGETLTGVTKELHLTGDEANSTTESFLKFARATKQDAAGAVRDFDDILDGYGLTAKSIVPIQDQLVKSSELYGGSVAANQRALADMAPQLKALNLTYNDGIALLNLFASSGLDAASAQRTLNQAVQNLPDGTNLNDIFTELSKIEDPAMRAARATEIFGSKAGPGIANAVKPGVAGLDSFRVTVEQSVGASRTAADAMDSSFGAQAQLRLKQFTSALVDLAKDFGPVVTGLAGIASLAGAIGFDELAKKLGPKLIGALKDVGAKAGDALNDGLVTGAGGTVVGNTIASRIENILDPTKPTLLGRIVKSAGAKAGALFGMVFGAAEGLASTLGGAVSGAIAKLPGIGMVRGAILAASIEMGTLAGTTMGTAMSLALKAAVLLGVAELASQVAGPLQDFGGQVHEAILGDNGPLGGIGDLFEGIGDAMENAPWPIGPKGAPDWAYLGGQNREGLKDAVSDPVDQTLATSAEALENYDVAWGDTMASVATRTGQSAAAVEDAERRKREAFGATRAQLLTDAQDLVSNYYNSLVTQDRLSATEAEIAAARRVLASSTSTAAEKADARSALHQLTGDRAKYLQDLAGAGADNTKTFNKSMGELLKELKTAHGAEKKAIEAEIIALQLLSAQAAIANGKILTLQQSITATLAKGGYVTGAGAGGHAEGGWITQPQLSWLGERGTEYVLSNEDLQRIGAWIANPDSGGGEAGVSIGQIAIYSQATDAHGIAEDIARELRLTLHRV